VGPPGSPISVLLILSLGLWARLNEDPAGGHHPQAQRPRDENLVARTVAIWTAKHIKSHTHSNRDTVTAFQPTWAKLYCLLFFISCTAQDNVKSDASKG
jgi:hypothetical protein